MAFEHVLVARHLGRELIHVALTADRDTDESGDVLADLLTIDQGLVTLDDAAGFELSNALHNGRSRKLHIVGYIGNSPTTVVLKNIKNF